MDQVPNILEDTSTKMRAIVKRSDKFLTKDADLYEKTKLFSKVLYDLTKLIELEPSKATLPELIIEHFDPEQVWAGVEIQNQQKFSALQSKFSSLSLGDLQNQSLLVGKPSVPASNRSEEMFEGQEEDEEEDEEEEAEEDSEDEESEEIKQKEEDSDHSDEDEEKSDDDILNDPDFQNMSDSDGDDLPLFENLDEDELNDEDDETEEGKVETKKKLEDSGGGRKTEVDDQFFKLSDMERFLDLEDKRELKKDENREDSNEEEVDLFEEMSGDEEMMYQDYFKHQETPAGGILEDSEDDDDDESEEEQEEEEDDEEEEGDDKTSQLLSSSDSAPLKSSHQLSQDRLARKISRLEEEALGEKAWQMAGEVSAPVRPENSLLSDHLEYDSAARAAPVITETVSRRLEDIILQRIKDKAWDDVERRLKPVEDPLDYKKKLVLDQEKSKLSLAQIYEEEYLKVAEEKTGEKKQAGVGLLDKEEEEGTVPGEVVEIKAMMNSLFRKLDSLSHLHFTPKQKSAELKIVRNIPSIAMEEVAPVAATNGLLLAPEEVVDKKKGELMDDKEKSKTDRRRDKREKKARLKAKIKEKERKEVGNKTSKQKALKKLEEAEKQGQVVNLNKREKDHSSKNSKTFFSSLQEEVKTQVREKASEKRRRDKSGHLNVASLKL